MNINLNYEPTEEQAAYVARHIQGETEENISKFNSNPAYMVAQSIKASKAICLLESDGSPLALVGVCDYHKEDTTTVGLVWMMATEEIKDSPIAFVKAMNTVIADNCWRYDFLISFVQATEIVHQKLHDMLGFTLTGEVFTAPQNKEEYYIFEKMTDKGLASSIYSGVNNA